MMMARRDSLGSAVDANAIPKELRERDKWVCWRYDGQDKVPISPCNLDAGIISVLDPVNWSEFETARQTAADHGSIEGIGYVFNTDAPIMGVDLDHCRIPETGLVRPWARDVINTFDSYTEVSPSGTGVHVYVKAGLPDGGCRNGDVEMYEGKRFFTVTGHHVDGTPAAVNDAQRAVNAVHGEWIANSHDSNKADNSNPQTSPSEALDLDDHELIEKAKSAQTGDQFCRVWNGEYSHQPSHSEARLELYNYLAFWTGKDQQQIWRLFQQSELYPHPETHGKCERLKDREIQKAIEDTTNSYDPDYHVDNDKLPNKCSQATADGGRLNVSDPTIVSVVEALEELGTASTSDIESSVDCSKRQVERAIDHLRDHGSVDWDRDGRTTVYSLIE